MKTFNEWMKNRVNETSKEEIRAWRSQGRDRAMRAASGLKGQELLKALQAVNDKDDAMDNASYYLHGGVDGEVSPERDKFGNLRMSQTHNIMSAINKLKNTTIPRTGYMEPILKWIQENPSRALDIAEIQGINLDGWKTAAQQHPDIIAKLLLADFGLEKLQQIIAAEKEAEAEDDEF